MARLRLAPSSAPLSGARPAHAPRPPPSPPLPSCCFYIIYFTRNRYCPFRRQRTHPCYYGPVLPSCRPPPPPPLPWPFRSRAPPPCCTAASPAAHSTAPLRSPPPLHRRRLPLPLSLSAPSPLLPLSLSPPPAALRRRRLARRRLLPRPSLLQQPQRLRLPPYERRLSWPPTAVPRRPRRPVLLPSLGPSPASTAALSALITLTPSFTRAAISRLATARRLASLTRRSITTLSAALSSFLYARCRHAALHTSWHPAHTHARTHAWERLAQQ